MSIEQSGTGSTWRFGSGEESKTYRPDGCSSKRMMLQLWRWTHNAGWSDVSAIVTRQAFLTSAKILGCTKRCQDS